ncbi:tRNA (guanosine(46)-N7)-methyltransferase TrmB [Hydrogenibacillus schlegelii]|uniref:tRNA (guanine-N(7)-)-methyltransferase n=1 Tax=Hydrogenibacillus schlegelii TaxID=1484 RepID=A0A179IM17_HYDSH|nr:tRNA (guanosine(46)-N7)-methyltransferase TrmB [Hydrogenibacillus schlegelii]OAR03405.1 hypothetical protein SA87_01340 [Hydrogenibacillus schlegelii]
MRLRHKPEARPALLAAPEVVHRPDGWPGKWRLLFFHRPAPLYVELGSGRGRFLVEAAEAEPGVNFVGVERKAEALYVAWRRVRSAERTNVGFIFDDVDRLGAYFHPGEIDRLYFHFSDPWPKRRHAKRRLTHPARLGRLVALLRPGGEVVFKTDHPNFYAYSREQLIAQGLVPLEERTVVGGPIRGPVTDYEARFLLAGRPIYAGVFRRDG